MWRRGWIAFGAVLLVACGSSVGSGGSLAPPASSTSSTSPTSPTINTAPTAQTATAGQPVTFTVVASGSAPLSYQWQRSGQIIPGATAASYVTAAATAADDGATFAVTVSNASGAITTTPVSLTVIAAAPLVDVLSYHNDNARSAQNLIEGTLTPGNVNATGFGLLRRLAADGLVDGQPLVVTNLSILGKTRNVVYVVTEHGSVYAYDADDGTALVKVSLLLPGETTSDSRSCDQVTPEIGITATPVIDRGAGAHGTLYAVAMSKDGSGRYYQRLHALDLVTLAEQAHSPVAVQATYAGSGDGSSNGVVSFDPAQYKERAGLLLLNGTVYTAWASHCDIAPYAGWIIGYDEFTLAQTRVLNVVPNGGYAAIWQAGGGMAADAGGNLYALVSNGTFETTLDAGGFPSNRDYGNAFIKVTGASPLQVVDYFAMRNAVAESSADVDLGSGAPMLLPDLQDGGGVVRHLSVGAGKDGHLYVVNRDDMGKFNPASNNIWQDLAGVLPGGVFSAPAYFNSTVYYADQSGTLKAFTVSQARLSPTPTSQSSMTFAYPGASPAVSANGASNGIVWAVESAPGQPAVLHAFDAGNLASELYNSNQAAAGRDHFGNGNKFVTPTIANGKVYVGTPAGVAVFGLIP